MARLTSTGSALSAATRVSSIRMASETDRPIWARTLVASSLIYLSIRARATSVLAISYAQGCCSYFVSHLSIGSLTFCHERLDVLASRRRSRGRCPAPRAESRLCRFDPLRLRQPWCLRAPVAQQAVESVESVECVWRSSLAVPFKVPRRSRHQGLRVLSTLASMQPSATPD